MGSRCNLEKLSVSCAARCFGRQVLIKFTPENPNMSVLVESKRTDKVDADNTNMTYNLTTVAAGARTEKA